MTYAITGTTTEGLEQVEETVGDPLLAYFGHHKCASTWIGRILWNVCADLGKSCDVYDSMQQLRDDFADETPPRDRVYAFMNAEYREFLRMRPFLVPAAPPKILARCAANPREDRAAEKASKNFRLARVPSPGALSICGVEGRPADYTPPSGAAPFAERAAPRAPRARS